MIPPFKNGSHHLVVIQPVGSPDQGGFVASFHLVTVSLVFGGCIVYSSRLVHDSQKVKETNSQFGARGRVWMCLVDT